MARPPRVSDEELLEIALSCFLEHGANASAQLIADRVGLSQPALFKRFGTKQELFLRAVLPPEHLPVMDWLEAHPEPGAFRPQVEALLEQLWGTLSWVLPRVQLLQEARIPRLEVFGRYGTAPPQRLVRGLTGFFERARQQGHTRAGVNPGLTATLVFGALMARSFRRGSMPDLANDDDRSFLTSTADTLCFGIAAHPEPTP